MAWRDIISREHLVFVEAKAYGSWSNSQIDHKPRRLDAIVGQAERSGLGLACQLTLVSPRPPARLKTSEWPGWALTPDGTLTWMSPATAGPRLGASAVTNSVSPARKVSAGRSSRLEPVHRGPPRGASGLTVICGTP